MLFKSNIDTAIFLQKHFDRVIKVDGDFWKSNNVETMVD